MDNQRRLTLNYLSDMFNGTFDQDIIEAVLEQRDWNTERALDDLMLMANGSTFNIPIEDFPQESLPSDALSNGQLCDEPENNTDQANDKSESEDDVIVVNEEEFCLPAESESEDEKSPSPEPPNNVNPAPKSYASVAKKPPPSYPEISRIKPPSILFTGYTSFERQKRTRDSIERVKLYVHEGFKIMVILRGCPGSGKSTLAKDILKKCGLTKNPYWYIHSADNYFHLNNLGTYQYDSTKIPEAHKWNQVNILHVIREGLTPIIVDNTHTRMWEMEPYAAMAVCAGYEIEVVEPDTPWAFHVSQLVKKNIHSIEKARIMMILQRYEYNISSSLLLKSFNLVYPTGNAPPQVGLRELTNKELVSLFEDLYNAIHVFPKQLKKLKKQQKVSRKAKKQMRKLEDQQLDEIVDSIENCGNTEKDDEAESNSSDDIELANQIVKSFADRKLASQSDTDQSWEDVSDESYVSANESESRASSSLESDDEENDDEEPNETESSDDSSSESEPVSENEADESTVAEIAPLDVPEETSNDEEVSMSSVNVMVDSFKNPINLDANDVSVEINANTVDKFSNRLYDALSKNGPRLRCFETFGDDLFDDDVIDTDAMEKDAVDAADPEIIQSVAKIIDEEPLLNIDPAPVVKEIDTSLTWQNTLDRDSSNSIVSNILNNALPLPLPWIDDKNEDLLPSNITEFPENLSPILLESKSRCPFDTTEFSEATDTNELKLNENVLSLMTESFQDVGIDSLNASLANPEVTVIYNEPDKLTDIKSNKSLKNLNASNSTEEDRNSLLDEAKRITCNADSDTSLSYKNNLNEGDDSADSADCDQILSSSKFKDATPDAIRMVIENDLWGDSFEDNTQAVGNDQNREPGSDVSENSDYGSNSSSSDELRIEDVHNSVNRFVNNDIKSDPLTEKKKPNINMLKNKNSTEDEPMCWNVDATVELNTLKERILVSSLDKVFNQRNAEDLAVETDTKSSNVCSRQSSTSGFQLIENKLNDKIDRTEDPVSGNDEDHGTENASDKSESKFWNQWMKGDDWFDDGTVTETEPLRPKNTESPTKQKNTETSNIRLVNDIKPGADKNKNLPGSQKMKSINFEPMVNDYFKYRSYPTTEDSLFGLPAAYDAKLKNVNVHDSKDSYYAMNPVQKKSNDESSDDGEPKRTGCSWSFGDGAEYDSGSASYVDPRRSPYRNFPKNSDVLDLQFLEKQDKANWNLTERNTTKHDDETYMQTDPKLNRKNAKKKVEDKTPEFVDELVQRWKSIAKEDGPPDYDKVLKWSPVNDSVEVDWNSDDNRSAPKANNSDRKPQRVLGDKKSATGHFLLGDAGLAMKRDKGTNTGTDNAVDEGQHRVAKCREINEGRESDDVSVIELKMKCDKSTMTNGSNYTVKAKPIREDLLNIFPKGMADSILDLYEKCNGNMDWIIEILMEDGYSPTDDQLEYLSSLQNVVNMEVTENSFTKEKDKPEKKKNKSNGNGKNVRRNNSHFDDPKEPPDTPKKVKRKKFEPKDESDPQSTVPDNNSFVLVDGELNEEEIESSVELFLDTGTVQQLIAYFGNPTVYSLKDCQPVVHLPISLARQIHAYLLESVIDQAERNEMLVNQLAEAELISSQFDASIENKEEVTQNDMMEVENSLYDVINSNVTPSATSEDSFASKLSLDLLLKSFPTLDPCFVNSTFKANNCNYYETKKVLNQMRQEVPTNLSFNLKSDHKSLTETIKTDDAQLFEVSSISRNDILEEVKEYREDAAFNYEQWQKFNEQLKTAIQRKRFGVAPYYRELMSAFKQKYDECNAKAAAVLINSCCLQNSNVIDLHFFKVTEALRALDIFLDHHISRLSNAARPKTTLYVITGRGARNADGVSHLQPPIKSRLKKRNIEFEVQPSNPGLVVVVVRKSSLFTHDL